MTNKIIPFFINSNLCTENDDIKDYKSFIESIAYNIGNSYITWSLIKELQGNFVKPYHIKNIWTYDYNNADKDIDIINNKCTHVFLILQDQIRHIEGYNQTIPFEKLKNFINKINKNIIVVSPGINQYFPYDYSENKYIKTSLENNYHEKLNKELVNFLQFLSHKTEIIGVRGKYTQEVFKKIGIHNTQIIGCPSFYESGKNKIVIKNNYNDIKNVLILKPCEQFKINKQDLNKNYFYTIQDEEKYLKAIFEKKIYKNEVSKQELYNWENKRYNTFSSIEDWKKYCSTKDFAFGTRIHGSILATNSNTPVLFFVPDLKGLEMAEYLNIPYTFKSPNELSIEEMYDLCDIEKLNSSYPKLYDNFENFMNKNGVQLFKNNNYEYEYDKQPTINQNIIKIKKYRHWYNFIFSINTTFYTRTFTICGIKITLKRKTKK